MKITGSILANLPDECLIGKTLKASRYKTLILARSDSALLCLLILLLCLGATSPALGEPNDDQTIEAGDAPIAVQQTQIWEDGTKFIGTIINGKREGLGTIVWPDGTRYSGEFKNDLRHGIGTMILPDGKVYNGTFDKGELVPGADRQAESGAPIADVSEDQAILPLEMLPPVREINDSVKADLRKMLTLWAAAWSEKNIEQYLANYHDEFKVPSKLSRRQWEILRRSRIKRPENISIELTFGDMEIADTNVARVQLTQAYQSDVYADITRKNIVLRRNDHGSWLIIAEEITN